MGNLLTRTIFLHYRPCNLLCLQWNIFWQDEIEGELNGGGSIGEKILHSSKYKLFKLNGYECRKRFSENVLHKLNGTVFGLLLWRLSSQKTKENPRNASCDR